MSRIHWGSAVRGRLRRAVLEKLEHRTLLSASLQMAITPQTISDPGNGTGANVTAAVTFTGPAVDTSTFGNGNFLAEGPNGFQTSVSYSGLSPQDPGPGHGFRIADYSVSLGTSSFTPSENGVYYFDPQPNQVSDSQLGFLLPTARVEAFDVGVTYVFPITATIDGQTLASNGTIDFGSTDTAFPGEIKTLVITNTLSQSISIQMANAAEVEESLGGAYNIVDVNDPTGADAIINTTIAAGASASFKLQFNEYGNNIFASAGAQASSFDITSTATGVTGLQDFPINVTGTFTKPASSVNLAGNIYNDANGNGQLDTGETAISGITTYIDLNDNGLYDPATEPRFISELGTFDFDALPAGDYTVREVVPPGSIQTSPTLDAGLLIGSDQTGNVSNLVFLQQQTPYATISGTVLTDTNNSGATDAGDAPASGLTVYLDTNNNGILDAGEPISITDSSGHYSIGALPTNSFVVRVALTDSSKQVDPAAGAGRTVYVSSAADYSGNDFLVKPDAAPAAVATITGGVFLDEGGSAGISAKSSLDSVTVYVDSNNNGQLDPGEVFTFTDDSGHYSLPVVSPEQAIVRAVPPLGLVAETPDASAGLSVDVSTATEYGGNDFLLEKLPAASLTGHVYLDQGHSGQFVAKSSVQDVAVYLDANNNGQFDPGETSTLTDANGFYTLSVSAPDVALIRVVPPTGTTQETPDAATGLPVNASQALVYPGNDFLLEPTAAPQATATLSGTVYVDQGGTSKFSIKSTFSDVPVYIDANNNGQFDAGETTVTTDANGAYAFAVAPGSQYVVRVQPPLGYSQELPASGASQTVNASGSITYGSNDFVMAIAPATPITAAEKLTAAVAVVADAKLLRVTQLKAQQATINTDVHALNVARRALVAAKAAARKSHTTVDPSLQTAVNDALSTTAADRKALHVLAIRDSAAIAAANKQAILARKALKK